MKQLTLLSRSTTLSALAVLLFICGSLTGCASGNGDPTSGQAAPTTNGQDVEESTSTAETVYIAAEFEEAVFSTEGIVKIADDIYIGTVLSAGETFSRYGHGDVWTPFAVAVEQRLLGNVEGTITVVQHGGFDPKRNIFVIVEEDPLLEVGETYMLASRTGRNKNRPEWEGQHVVQAVKGHVRIQNEAHRQQLIQEYAEAIDRAGRGS